MKIEIVEYGGSAREDDGIATLLSLVYVQGGFTEESTAKNLFAPTEVTRRGNVILAKTSDGKLVGMIICAPPGNPYRQIATSDEAEMHLLAVAPGARGKGLGRALCLAFEDEAEALGYGKLVLSTQPAMHAAHRLYESLGYRRNPARDWSRACKQYFAYEKSLAPRESGLG